MKKKNNGTVVTLRKPSCSRTKYRVPSVDYESITSIIFFFSTKLGKIILIFSDKNCVAFFLLLYMPIKCMPKDLAAKKSLILSPIKNVFSLLKDFLMILFTLSIAVLRISALLYESSANPPPIKYFAMLNQDNLSCAAFLILPVAIVIMKSSLEWSMLRNCEAPSVSFPGHFLKLNSFSSIVTYKSRISNI